MHPITHKIRKHKLTLGFLLIILLFLCFGIFTARGLFTLGQLTKTIYEHPLVVSNASLVAGLNMTKMHRSMKDVVLANSTLELEKALQMVAEGEASVYRQLDIVRENILGEDGQTLERETRQLFTNWKPIRDEVIGHLKAGNVQEAETITKAKGADHVLMLETKMLELSSYARKKASRFLENAESKRSKLETITIFLTMTGVLFSALIAFITTFVVVKSEKKLQEEKNKLQDALDEIKTLRGIIPICSHCRQVRDDEGLWKQIEEYIRTHSEAMFSHGICPDCLKEHYPEQHDVIMGNKKS